VSKRLDGRFFMPSEYIKRPKSPESTPALFPDWDQLPDGWELLVADDVKKKRFNFTGKRCAQDRERYQALVEAIGSGAPADLICKVFHVHHRTLAAIAEREKVSIDDLKKKAGELMLKTSHLSVRSFLEDLLGGKVDPKTKAIAAGIFAQNGLVLTGQPSAILAVEDRRDLTPEAVNGFWERAKRVTAALAPEGGSGAEEAKGQ
jgi:hypothetical protein